MGSKPKAPPPPPPPPAPPPPPTPVARKPIRQATTLSRAVSSAALTRKASRPSSSQKISGRQVLGSGSGLYNK